MEFHQEHTSISLSDSFLNCIDLHRFGFNGQEKDDEWTGSTGATYDYGFRIYDSRIARFLSVDPLFQSYPWYSPYQFAGNMPIAAIDLDGLEEFVVIRWYDSGDKYTGSTIFKIDNADDRLQANGTLIVNSNNNNQENFNSNIDTQFKDKLFNVNSEGNPISLKGGKIVNESSNLIERNQIGSIGTEVNGEVVRRVFGKYGTTDIDFGDPDNVQLLSTEQIDKFKNALNVNPEFGIEVSGHASQEPNTNVTPEHNQRLSEERAGSVAVQLEIGGISGSRIAKRGAGTSEPKYSNTTEAGRRKNRRAEVGLTIPKSSDYD